MKNSIMSKGTSRGLLLTPEEELAELQKHLTILENERKTLIEESRVNSTKNKETIFSLQTEKAALRSRVKSANKYTETDEKRSKPEESEEVLKLRRKFDQLHSLYKAKVQHLKTIKDKLSEVPVDPKTAATEEVPINRQIRVLENRLDKAMIKYNEAQSIRKTYEQIVKQLKQERAAYDNQLAAVERSLRGKEHDFEELLLLGHDANHAKETAEAELCRVEAQVMVERLTRTKNVEDKKEEVHKRIENTKKQESAESQGKSMNFEYLDKSASGAASNAHIDQRLKEEKHKLKDYEGAFRRIKEATGLVDANEIIQKFGTQGDTYNNLEALKLEHQKRLESLNAIKKNLKHQTDTFKYHTTGELESKKKLKDSQADFARVMKKYEKSKSRLTDLNKVMKNTINGIEHITSILSGFKTDDAKLLEINEDNVLEVLAQCQNKMKKIYFLVRESQFFSDMQMNAPILTKPLDTAQRTATMLTSLYNTPELANTYAQGFKQGWGSRRQRTDEDEVFSEDPSETLNETGNANRDKLLKENSIRPVKVSKGFRARRASSSVGKKKRN